MWLPQIIIFKHIYLSKEPQYLNRVLTNSSFYAESAFK
jgi:hypothetical protein